MPATTHADRVERQRALAITCPACDAPPGRYCRKWLPGKTRWEPYKPRHLHTVRISAGHAAAAKTGKVIAVDIETTGVNPFADPDGPTLKWERLSAKRYTAQGLGGAVLEIVRSYNGHGMRETWRAVVFGNRFAYARTFERWREAAIAAEKLAVEYASRVQSALAGMPIARRYGR